MASGPEEDRREVKAGGSVSLQPFSPVELKINFVYKGKLLSFPVRPNELYVHEYKHFILMVRHILNDGVGLVKWATIDKYGNSLDEGEI
jgi:hypothetical protein